MTINPCGAFKAKPCLAAKHEAQIAREMQKVLGREGRAPENTKITGGSEDQLKHREAIRVRIIEVVKEFGPMSSRDVHAELPDLSWHQIRHYLIEMRRAGRVKCWKDKTRIANWYVEDQADGEKAENGHGITQGGISHLEGQAIKDGARRGARFDLVDVRRLD